MKINLNSIVLVVLFMLPVVFTSCRSDILPGDEEVNQNEESKIIGETILPVGRKATYMLNAPGASDHKWSFPNNGIIAPEGTKWDQPTITLKGMKKGKVTLKIHYKEEGYSEFQQKYITVTVY